MVDPLSNQIVRMTLLFGKASLILSMIAALGLLTKGIRPDIANRVSAAIDDCGLNVILRFKKLILLFLPYSRMYRQLAAEMYPTPKRLLGNLKVVYPSPHFIRRFSTALRNEGGICVTGVSGSGKTTAVLSVFHHLQRSKDDPPLDQIPVYVRASKLMLNRSSASVERLVSEAISSQRAFWRNSVSRKLIHNGALLLIFDDLEFLDDAMRHKVQEFVDTARNNSFVCIITERPGPFVPNFEAFVPEKWGAKQITSYVFDRVGPNEGREILMKKLVEWEWLNKPRTPLLWSYIVDLYKQNELFLGLEPNISQEYHIQESYLRAVLGSSDPVLEEELQKLGRLSLDLIKNGQTLFDTEKAHLDESRLRVLTPRLFEREGEKYMFSHSNNQSLLAGRYLAKSWPTARHELEDPAAVPLVWTTVYRFAESFIDKQYLQQLRDAFRGLSARARLS